MHGRHDFPIGGQGVPVVGTLIANQQLWGHGWKATLDGWEAVRLEDGERCNGFGMEYPNVFIAVFASGGGVWLQADTRSWSASGIVRVVQRYERARSAAYDVQFADGTTEQIKLTMPAAVVAHRLIDPTYDEIDSLDDDIMKLFPYVASDGWTSGGADVHAWVGRVRPLWETGVKHGP